MPITFEQLIELIDEARDWSYTESQGPTIIRWDFGYNDMGASIWLYNNGDGGMTAEGFPFDGVVQILKEHNIPFTEL